MTVTTASTNTTETVLLPFYLPNISSLIITDMPGFLEKIRKNRITPSGRFLKNHKERLLAASSFTALSQQPEHWRDFYSRRVISVLYFMSAICHPAGSPLDLYVLKQGLEHVRLTLADINIRYSLFANEAPDVESLSRILTGSMGTFAAFPSLTSLHISPGVLFGQISPSDAPPLASVLPPHLQRLTIFDDLWDYNAYYEWIDGIAIMALFRVFLEGAPGEGPCWKEAVPELKIFVLDMSNNRWAGELSQEDIEDLKRMAEAQGMTCKVLEPLDSDDEDNV
jgi:hypothetical protein